MTFDEHLEAGTAGEDSMKKGKTSGQATSIERILQIKQNLAAEVIWILESRYRMDMNTAEKIVEQHFEDGVMPNYYFISNSAGEIAGHIFIISQMLNANTDFIRQESDDGKALTYFVNVGRDVPGRLARIIEANLSMRINSFDSVKSSTGVRIITLEQAGRRERPAREDEVALMEAVKKDCLDTGGKRAATFLYNLPQNYLYEEINVLRTRSRIKRHLELFSRALDSDEPVVSTEETDLGGEILGQSPEARISVAVKNPDRGFVLRVLVIFAKRRINLHRSYLDTFGTGFPGESVQILTVYADRKSGYGDCLPLIPDAVRASGEDGRKPEDTAIESRIEVIVRGISDPDTPGVRVGELMSELRRMLARNRDTATSEEKLNFLLNALTDFYRAAEFLGIHDSNPVMRRLMRYEHLSEFYVSSNRGGRSENLPGYRFVHNNSRGGAKGGLRLDPIVQFDEVCALSFMMTWKNARAKILFGGAKGGLVISPGDYADRPLDFMDTTANFGRSLFLVTGPVHDIPAGDVGCGPSEIGILFEGFKSALRDLALVAYGVKAGVTVVGNRVISLEEARRILKEHFDVDWGNRKLLRRIITDEYYLELVVAPQITGKPRMGIAARTGATGRGLLYCVLAMVTRLYLQGKWKPAEEPTKDERKLLESVAGYNEREVLLASGRPVVNDPDWDTLVKSVYPKLLKNKRMIVQGTGKVGGSVLSEFMPYGVNVIAVADAGGAIIGDQLNVAEILDSVNKSRERSCIGAVGNVERTIRGAKEGSAVLEMECDILLPCALENVITADVASRLKARLVASGGNGTNTSKGECILEERGIAAIYDFLANGGGVTASYFEWLRNFYDRRRFESESIQGEEFQPSVMEPYIMPEYRQRVLQILSIPEGPEATARWNLLLRDIMFSAVNDDYDFADSHSISLKTAGFANAILRVMGAILARSGSGERSALWEALPARTREMMRPFLTHPEVRQLAENPAAIEEIDALLGG